MAAGSGNYVIAIFTTVMALIGLIFFKFLERLYPKDSYRILSISTPIEADVSQIIEIVKKHHLKILNCNVEKNYEKGTSLTLLSIRLFQRGITDKLAHKIIDSLEGSSLTLNEVKWEQS